MLTCAFSGRLARTIRGGFAERVARHGTTAPYPAQNWLTATLREAAINQGRSDLIPLYAGQSASLLCHRNASELFHALVSETDDMFGSAAQKVRSV